MFYQERFQTGEIKRIIDEMLKGSIPCMDVLDSEEMEWFIKNLKSNGIYRIEDIPYDRFARDRVKEPEFEYRAAFHTAKITSSELNGTSPMYIDFYFEPDIERTYDPVGEM